MPAPWPRVTKVNNMDKMIELAAKIERETLSLADGAAIRCTVKRDTVASIVVHALSINYEGTPVRVTIHLQKE